MKAAKRIQLALEEHVFELHESTYTQLFFFFFSAENTTVLHNLQQKVNYKLHADFQLHRGLVPLMPTLFKGQLWVLKVLITRKKK